MATIDGELRNAQHGDTDLRSFGVGRPAANGVDEIEGRKPGLLHGVIEFHDGDRLLKALWTNADNGGHRNTADRFNRLFESDGSDRASGCVQHIGETPAHPEAALRVEVANIAGAMPAFRL